VDTVKDPAEMPIGGMNYSHPANPESLCDDSVVSEIPHGTSICPGLPADNANRRMAEYYRLRLPLPVVVPEKLLRGVMRDIFCASAFNTAYELPRVRIRIFTCQIKKGP
jgi:hypothetical protein